MPCIVPDPMKNIFAAFSALILLNPATGQDTPPEYTIENRQCVRLERSNVPLTDLDWAIINNDMPMFISLQEQGARSMQGDNGLEMAIRHGRLLMVQYLLNHRGKFVSPLNSAILADAGNELCEHSGSRLERAEIMRVLIENGTDIQACNSRGMTPLMYTAYCGQMPLVKLLTEKGAKVNAVNRFYHGKGSWCKTPLGCASARNHLEITKYLLDRGTKINDHNGGITALWEASAHGHVQIAELLIAHGADVNIPAQSGTPLMKAAENGHVELVALLLKARANTNWVSKDNYPAIAAAAQVGANAVIELLLANGARVDLVGYQKYTALMLAAQNNHLKTVELLIRAGANRNLQDAEGKTALDHARLKHNTRIAELLEK